MTKDGADHDEVVVYVTRDGSRGGVECVEREGGGALAGTVAPGEHPALAADRIARAAVPKTALATDLFAYRKLAVERGAAGGKRHVFQVSPEAAWPDRYVGEDGARYLWAPFPLAATADAEA